jgi:hypothetical protein
VAEEDRRSCEVKAGCAASGTKRETEGEGGITSTGYSGSPQTDLSYTLVKAADSAAPYAVLCYNSAPRGTQTMADVSSIVRQLKQERNRVERQLTGLNAALTAFAAVYSGNTNGKRQISAAGRKRIAAAQRARWEKVRGKAKVATPRRTMSASSRRKIVAAQRRRWAKFRAGKK